MEFIEFVGFVEFVGYQWRCDKDWWRQVEFVAFVGFIEFVELIKTETRRLVETNRDTLEELETGGVHRVCRVCWVHKDWRHADW